MKETVLFVILIAVIILIPVARLVAQHQVVVADKGLSTAFNPYSDYPVYDGDDLGVTYTAESTVVKVWSPPAEAMKLKLYQTGRGNDPVREVVFNKGGNGVWVAMLEGDMKNYYYTVQVKTGGQWLGETPDPYARATGINGLRGQIIDLKETDPPGWANDKAPVLRSPTDAVVYELHLRDLSVDPGSGIKHKGKYLGLAETGTFNSHGQPTGLDHIVWMGVTHVHLLPVFDFSSVDEAEPSLPQFNWGYDPQHYNVPEGSYATDAADGKVRILEFKKMVHAMHRQGLRVVMDVVYNHTAKTGESVFDRVVPGYYYRQWEKDGTYSNASGCGNETASDRAMMRKFIIESVCYWVKEYHVDGFRFDLMAIHDIETMNLVSEALHAIDPSILIYGEGWTAGDSPLPEKSRALKKHVNQLNDIAVFSDDIRDGIKGSVFDEKSTGFASGAKGMTESVKFGLVGGGIHPQVDYSKVNYSKEPWTKSPAEVINYVSCHDNHTLYDKLKISRPDATEEELIRMHKLANTIVLTSQGIPFLHAGVEMKRTKGGEHNSYNKPDSVNRIDWNWKHENSELVAYYHDLIALRKEHPAFRMTSAEMVRNHLEFLTVDGEQIVAYLLKEHANGDEWGNILVIFNGSDQTHRISLPGGTWYKVLSDYRIKKGEQVTGSMVGIAPVSAMILYSEPDIEK